MANNIVAQMQVLISAQTKGLNTALSQSTSALKTFEGAIGKANTLLTSFGIGIGAAAIANIAGQVVEVTAQFEKFGAVLANTLGSDSAAQAALDSIREFAQETPFEVSEVTAAYVRWANQGLNPTIDKMGKLGDVASSLGAGFEQTAEAFKDLLVGQTKRIEEIGISAQQSNGKIQLSFKGVTIEIDKTAEGVQKALDTFSQLNGVLGTSDKVSKELGGRLSTLRDAYGNLLLTIGTGNSGALKESVNILIDLTNAATKVVGAFSNTDTAFGKFISSVVQNQLAPAKFFLQLINGADETNKKLKEQEQRLQAIQSTAQAAFDSGNVEAYIKALDSNINKEKIIEEIRRRETEQKAALEVARVAEIETLGKLQSKLKQLNEDFEDTDKNDTKKLASIGQQIFSTNAQIEALERLRKKQAEVNELSAFGKAQLEKGAIGIGITGTEFEMPKLDVENIFPTTIPIPDIGPAMAALQTYTDAVKVAGAGAIVDFDQMRLHQEMVIAKQQQMTETIMAFGSAIIDAAASGKNVLHSLLQTVISTAKQFILLAFKESIAGTIAGAAKTKAPPPVILALAALGIAGISAMFAKIGGPSGSGSGGGGSFGGSSNITNVNRIPPVQSQANQVQQEHTFVIHGNDLVAMATNEQNRLRRLGR